MVRAVGSLRSVGAMADTWSSARDQIDGLVRERASLSREQAALRVRIGEVKTHIAQEGARGQLDTLREQVASLDQGIARSLDELSERAEPITRYFDRFSGLGDLADDKEDTEPSAMAPPD
jgi:hypothetical protein